MRWLGDYKIPEPFEINSLMNEVFAGDVTFTLEVNLPVMKVR